MFKSISVLILSTLFVISCNKDEIDPGASSTNDTSNFNTNKPTTPIDSLIPFIKATVNFNNWYAKQNYNGYIQITSNNKIIDSQNSLTKVDYISCLEQDTAVSSYMNQYNENFEVAFSGNQYGIAAYANTHSLFYASFPLGYLTYYSSSSPSNEGPEIIYTDSNGAKWSSKYGDQTGSIFNVTKSQSEVDEFGYPYQIVEGDFSCKVYSVTNPQPNQYLQISYGQFMLNYVKP
jgi:hypothetical protein